MDALQVIAPLIGVILGGAISGIGGQLRARKERKRVIGLALTELLEIRHNMVAGEYAIKKLMSLARIKPELLPPLRNQIDSLLPSDPYLDDRYNTAVSLLAGIDPVLAFKMRSRNNFPKVLSKIRTAASDSKIDLAVLESFETMLRAAITPSITQSIEQLARNHSFETAYKVKKLIAQSDELSPEGAQFFNQLEQLFLESASTEKSAQ